VGTQKTLPADEVAEALQRVIDALARRHANTSDLVLLGIANGGVAVCQRVAAGLARALGRDVPHGVVNVAFHRDDLGRNPIPRVAHPTEIPVDLDDATVVLVDDVIFSGRTVRAAMEEVFANGRPAAIELAVLVDRGDRRLPIAPDCAGIVLETTPEQKVEVRLDNENPSRDTITISQPA